MATDTATPDVKPLFSPKEEQVMQVAWLCLKSGPPDVDINRLVKLAGFNTLKTASNTWGVIKKKLLSMPEAQGAGFLEKADGASAESTKAANGTKKRGGKITAAVNNEASVENTTKKRKSPAKETQVEEETAAQSDSALSAVNEELVAEAPTKKKRKSPVKKTQTEGANTIAVSAKDASKEDAEALDEIRKDAETVENANNTEIEVKVADVADV